MLQYNRIDISEGIDFEKTSASKQCTLCHYLCLKIIDYKFERHVFNKCHDVLMTTYKLKSIAILTVKVDYRFFLWSINKNEAVNILNNSVLEDKDVI